MARIAVVFLLLFLSTSAIANAQPTTEVLFSPRGGATEGIVDFIHSAKRRIRVAAYNFSSKNIASALLDAHRRGVDVKVVLDRSNNSASYSSATFLTNYGIPTRINAEYQIMHSKYIIVDGVSIQTGSFNYTKVAEERNAENVIFLRNQPEIAEQYSADWQKLWDESKEYERRM